MSVFSLYQSGRTKTTMGLYSLLSWFCLIFLLVVVEPNTKLKKSFKKKGGFFECPTAFGLYANPFNCRWFYTCNGFVPYDTPCPSPLYFDDAKKMCVYRTKDLQCGPVAVVPEVPTTPDPNAAPDCIPAACKLPDCFCSSDGTRVPGNLLPKETPQMIILAFSGSLNILNAEPFSQLLNDSRTNPNGCPIKATFFIPHEYTSYFYVQKLYGQGHEIAMQTITNRQPEDFWSKATTEEWAEEVIGMKEILHTFANVSREDLLGVRAPFLKPGGNQMLSMIYDFGLEYDSSVAAPLSEVPLWPYTLDFHMSHKCLADNCPTRSFPGVWEFPLNTMESNDGTGGSCVLLDQCIFPDDPEEILEFLNHNFERHYVTNRAPLLLNLHVNWVTDDSKVTALDVFIDHVQESYPDVWFVTMQQALNWMRHPVSANFAPNFDAWKCPKTRLPGCNLPKTCALSFSDGVLKDTRYMQLCGKCPEKYPWLHNVRGTNEGKKVLELVQKTV